MIMYRAYKKKYKGREKNRKFHTKVLFLCLLLSVTVFRHSHQLTSYWCWVFNKTFSISHNLQTWKEWNKRLCHNVDYEQSLCFLGPSSQTPERRKWPRAWLKARDGTRGTAKGNDSLLLNVQNKCNHEKSFVRSLLSALSLSNNNK